MRVKLLDLQSLSSVLASTTYGFCLTDLFFHRVLQIGPSPPKAYKEEQPFGIAKAQFLQARCPSRHNLPVTQPKKSKKHII